MSVVAIVWVGLGLAAGLAAGLYLRRQAAFTATLEARLAADRALAIREEQLRSRDDQLVAQRTALAEAEQQQRASQERVEVLSTALARAEVSRDATARRFDEAARELDALNAEADASQAELERLRLDNVRLCSQLEAEQRARELTQGVLDEKGQLMLEQSRQDLDGVLAPLRERLKLFEEKVEKTYDQENRDRASLLNHLKGLQEAQTRLHRDAENLSRALSGHSRTRGSWGEVILERVLETAGLAEGREYRLQVSRVDEQGASKRPDAVVYLPGDRAVVVDSKCPLAAFIEASAAESPEAREALLDAHVEAVRTQVSALADKRYQDVIEGRTLDFVMLFIPNEAAFHAALGRRTALYEEAFRQGVHLCSPTTLLAALQLVAQVWRTEKQNTHARQIADEAARLLDKLGAFEEDLLAVSRKLGSATESFEDAKKKLLTGRGSVKRHATKMAELGARLPQGERARIGLPDGLAPDEPEAEDEADEGEEDSAQRALGLELPPGKAPSA